MDPSSSKPRRSAGKFLREKSDKLFSHSSPPFMASQHPSPTSSTHPPSPSPPPVGQPTVAPHADPAPATTEVQALIQTSLSALAVTHPIPASSRDEPPESVEPRTIKPSTPTKHLTPLASDTCPILYKSLRATAGVWSGLDSALRALHKGAELFPPVQSAIGAFLPCLDLIEDISKHRHEYEVLASEITSLTEFLAQHMNPSTPARMSGSIATLARGIEEQANLIRSKRGRGVGRRLVETNKDEEELARCFHQIGSLFRQLQVDANLSVWGLLSDQTTQIRLDRLAPVSLADHDSKLSTAINRCTCTNGTRTTILSELNKWSHDPGGAYLYWMNGMAGTGKTTIAYTFSESLEEHKHLAASFFCTRTVPECRDVSRIIPTIAYQLAQYSMPFQSTLCEVLGTNPNLSAKNVTKQFERLLKEPLLKVKEAIPSGLVVVVDALDECGDMLEVELLLSVLLKSAADIPLKFFVTSRPEPEIYKRMMTHSQGGRVVMHLHEVEKSLVQADIELYLGAELEFMLPTPIQIKELARRSGTLFIYAATLVRYIRSRKAQTDPQWRLQSVLSMTSEPTKQYAAVDALYGAVLKAALDDEGLEAQEIENVRRVLRTVICVQEPVSLPVLAALAGLNSEGQTLAALQPLRAVLHVSEISGLVSALHASFPDFMFDESRSQSFCCKLAIHSELVTRHCFKLMESQLRFNICKLKSSFVPDSEVATLDEQVKQAISSPLSYACHYWGNHLEDSAYSDSLSALLNDFLSNGLLFWMEVLNLKQEIGSGVAVLLKARQWLRAGAAPPDIARLAEDARNFVTSFAANPVSRSTPHIYISLLPFCPKSSIVFKKYWKKTKGLINVAGSAMHRREAAALARWKACSAVNSITYSPDGSCVAIGCDDQTITIRNAHDGTLVGNPLKGHTGSVLSVAYSPGGTHIVSGSKDKTIRVWNVHDDTPVTDPLEGHAGPVWSVAYSPDGNRLVSGSEDYTIRVWNAHDGTPAAGPFEGHAGPVWSATYSPDSTRIVSGSDDDTIRVWNAHDGTPIAGPLKGHTKSVLSVAYSPDGTHIVSGSEDKTVRVWNAHDGTPIASPLRGHTTGVMSVAYSPNGARIVSGSEDRTIRVWSVHGGAPVVGSLDGHAGMVCSVAYSPDGTRIVSGSADQTIRVWNAHDSTTLTSPPEGHTSVVMSVAYSPDGSRIVSGSEDYTIRVWNAHDGTPAAGPFEGHAGSVWSVAYSPDSTRVVSGSDDQTIRIWNAHNGTLLVGPLKGHASGVMSVAYSPDGRHIVSGSADRTIRLWNAYDGVPVSGPLEGHTTAVLSVAYSPDGAHIVSGSFGNTIRVWNAHNGTPVVGPLEGHTDTIWSVAYSPNGARIVSGSGDKTIRVWDARDGRLVAGPLRGHTSMVLSVAYSPDGARIVSSSEDRTIRVWNAHDGTPIAGPLKGHTDAVLSVAYSPDGTRIASGSEDKTIRVWNTHDNTPVASPLEGLSDYSFRDDGWVVGPNAPLLFWAPHELKFSCTKSSRCCVLVIARRNPSVGIDYGDMLVGERWDQCYNVV